MSKNPGGATTQSRSLSRRGAIAAALSVGLAMVAVVVLLMAPLGRSMSATTESHGSEVVEESTYSLVEHEGWSVVFVVSVPLLIAGAGAALGISRRKRTPVTVAAGLLWAFVIVGVLSIGVFFVPAAIAMAVAAFPARSASRPGSEILVQR